MDEFNKHSAGKLRISTKPNPQPVRRPEKYDWYLTKCLARRRPGEVEPLRVLELLINHYNSQHTAFEKNVSFKTRRERAQFLRRFFRGLTEEAGFKTLPDPRNLGARHVRAMVRVWQKKKLSPATVQTYFSFLRGLASWLGKTGSIQSPAFYGMEPSEFRRTEVAQSDKSWSAAGVNIDALIDEVCAFDRYVGGSLKLIRNFGLRRKESIMFRPYRYVVPFEATGLALEEREADEYVLIKAGAKGGRPRYIPLNTQERRDALAYAQAVAGEADAHMGQPGFNLLQNMRRFDYVMEKFGATNKQLGVTIHGLRHEALIDHYQNKAGVPPPIRGGGVRVSRQKDAEARLSAARLAGHNRRSVSSAYLGGMIARREALPNRDRRSEPKEPSE